MSKSIQEIALKTIGIEAAAISSLSAFIDHRFEQAVETIQACTGRIVVSGIGKSAIIAQKIVATFNSTGTPALFMHAADAIHGDLGMIQDNDVVIIISKSGESPEIKVLVPLVRNFGNPIIGMVGNAESFLAKNATVVLNTYVEQEACPNNLAPTTSTTAQLVMGDTLAVCLMELRGFRDDDFARYHPGGTLGKKLYLRVSDLYGNNQRPHVQAGDSLKAVIVSMTAGRLGMTAVVDADNRLLGIITDGDLRRMLEKNSSIDQVNAGDIMTKNPWTIAADEMAANAMEQLRAHEISQLVVVEGDKYLGILHLHDLIREGLI